MNKKFSLRLLLIMTLISLSCTSKQQVSEEPIIDTQVVDQQLAEIDNSPAIDESSAAFGGDSIPSVEEGLGEANPTDVATPSAESSNNEMFQASGAGSDSIQNQDSLANEPPPTSQDKPVTQESLPSENVAAVDPVDEKPAPSVAPASKPPVAVTPISKIETAPFRRGGFLLNAVYIARPGDDFKRVAQKIYGNKSKAKDLRAMNPGVSTLRVGTKIYYNSPNRPEDQMSLKFYYEDIGMQPQVFVSQKEENLKTKAKELLGFSGAWKEIWSTNQSLDSQKLLPAGTEVYYWPDLDVASATAPKLANTPESSVVPPIAPPAQEPLSQDNGQILAMNDVPPPPPVDAAPPVEEFTPPPPPPSIESVNPPAPPPPPPVETANPPAPTQSPAPTFEPPQVQAAQDEEVTDEQDEMMMILGAIGILSAGAAALIVIRKRRQQKEAMAMAAMESTHVGVVNK